MKENSRNQPPGIQLPPVWCGSICRNAMNEKCIEDCAIKRDCSGFEPMKGISLIDLPRFPDTAGLSREEKYTIVAYYLAKIVDHLQGVQDEPTTVRRPHPYRPPGRAVSTAIEVKDLLPDIQTAVSLSEGGQEREGERVGSEKLAGPTD